MIEITVIVGLPGSGKTMLAHEMVREHGAFLIDDIAQNLDEIEVALVSGASRLVITDANAVAACRDAIESKLREWFGQDPEIIFIAFENNVDACLANLAWRAVRDDRIITSAGVRSMSKCYVPEKISSIVRPVWKRRDT